jgi:nicotinate-nucleotide adenylyltransferase
MRRIAIFGGTFNPVHLGHMNYALHCQEQFAFDAMLFIPTNLPPHKSAPGLASNADRMRMLELATEEYPAFQVSDIEYRLGGRSYTVDTLSALRREIPEAEFSLLIGSDMLRTFPQWREYRAILQQARLIAAAREPGEAALLEQARAALGEDAERVDILPIPVFPVSSTEIRAVLKAGGDAAEYLHPAVYAYIRERRLYQ